MLRFRTLADENLYLALRTELYVAAAQLNDPALTSLIMRNFGKLEALVHMEGVRQGLAAAALSRFDTNNELDIADKRPSQVLAAVYGDAATPLWRAERQWIHRADGSEVPESELPAWLDRSDARFPAMTYAEAMGIEQPKPPMYKVDAPHAPVPVVQPAPRAPVSDQELSSLFEDDPSAPAPGPDQLAHYRDELVAMKAAGVAVGSWSELILTLSLRLGEDAGFIDLALGTDSGRLVLSQAGYDVHPGTAAVMQGFVGEIPGQSVDLLPSKPADEPPPDAIE